MSSILARKLCDGAYDEGEELVLVQLTAVQFGLHQARLRNETFHSRSLQKAQYGRTQHAGKYFVRSLQQCFKCLASAMRLDAKTALG